MLIWQVIMDGLPLIIVVRELDHIKERERFSMVKLLVNAGADIYKKDENGQSVFNYSEPFIKMEGCSGSKVCEKARFSGLKKIAKFLQSKAKMKK